jgi:hypothetical protein
MRGAVGGCDFGEGVADDAYPRFQAMSAGRFALGTNSWASAMCRASPRGTLFPVSHYGLGHSLWNIEH